MSHLSNLNRNRTNIRITEHLPQEIHARRNKLWPKFIQARQEGKDANFIKDKLIVNKEVMKSTKDQVTDINMNVSSRSLELHPQHTSLTTVQGSHFQGHIVPLKSKDDVVPAIQALCADQRVAGANHTHLHLSDRA